MLRSMIILIVFSGLMIGCNEQQQSENATANKSAKNLAPGQPTYSVPAEWKSEKPKSRMRKAQYRIPGAEGSEDAEMAVFVFPGTGGSVQANVDRWVGQFVQPDGSDSKEKTETKKMTVNNLPITTVYLTGTYLQSTAPMMMNGPKEEKPGYAMLAAIVETSKDPWFFKMVGPQKTVDQWRPEFDKFVSSMK